MKTKRKAVIISALMISALFFLPGVVLMLVYFKLTRH